MSEASETLHLWRATHAQTRSIAMAAGVIGRIIASNDRWTSFVPLEDDELSKLASVVPGLSLHWQYFEDFFLGLGFWEAGLELGRLELAWGDAPNHSVAPNLIERLRVKGVIDSFQPLQELAYRVAMRTCLPEVMRDRVAALLAIPAYEWLSPRYSRDTTIEEIRRVFPDAEEIDSL